MGGSLDCHMSFISIVTTHVISLFYPLIQGTLSVREDFQYYESHSDKKKGFVEEWPLRSHVWEINNVKKQLCRNEIRKVSYIT